MSLKVLERISDEKNMYINLGLCNSKPKFPQDFHEERFEEVVSWMEKNFKDEKIRKNFSIKKETLEDLKVGNFKQNLFLYIKKKCNSKSDFTTIWKLPFFFREILNEDDWKNLAEIAFLEGGVFFSKSQMYGKRQDVVGDKSDYLKAFLISTKIFKLKEDISPFEVSSFNEMLRKYQKNIDLSNEEYNKCAKSKCVEIITGIIENPSKINEILTVEKSFLLSLLEYPNFFNDSYFNQKQNNAFYMGCIYSFILNDEEWNSNFEKIKSFCFDCKINPISFDFTSFLSLSLASKDKSRTPNLLSLVKEDLISREFLDFLFSNQNANTNPFNKFNFSNLKKDNLDKNEIVFSLYHKSFGLNKEYYDLDKELMDFVGEPYYGKYFEWLIGDNKDLLEKIIKNLTNRQNKINVSNLNIPPSFFCFVFEKHYEYLGKIIKDYPFAFFNRKENILKSFFFNALKNSIITNDLEKIERLEAVNEEYIKMNVSENSNLWKFKSSKSINYFDYALNKFKEKGLLLEKPGVSDCLFNVVKKRMNLMAEEVQYSKEVNHAFFPLNKYQSNFINLKKPNEFYEVSKKILDSIDWQNCLNLNKVLDVLIDNKNSAFLLDYFGSLSLESQEKIKKELVSFNNDKTSNKTAFFFNPKFFTWFWSSNDRSKETEELIKDNFEIHKIRKINKKSLIAEVFKDYVFYKRIEGLSKKEKTSIFRSILDTFDLSITRYNVIEFSSKPNSEFLGKASKEVLSLACEVGYLEDIEFFKNIFFGFSSSKKFIKAIKETGIEEKKQETIFYEIFKSAVEQSLDKNISNVINNKGLELFMELYDEDRKYYNLLIKPIENAIDVMESEKVFQMSSSWLEKFKLIKEKEKLFNCTVNKDDDGNIVEKSKNKTSFRF